MRGGIGNVANVRLMSRCCGYAAGDGGCVIGGGFGLKSMRGKMICVI